LMGNHDSPAGSCEGGSVWDGVGVCIRGLSGKCLG
jgi:hypothetical protein